MRFCLVCSQWLVRSESRLCGRCVAHLEELRCPLVCEDVALNAIFFYQDPLRSLVLKAKIKDDYQALRFLVETFVSAPATGQLAEWCDVAIPAPSSLWGRIHGRFDIAFMLTAGVAKKYGKPMAVSSARLYWRVKKRAFELRTGKIELSQIGKVSGGKKILLIDDVVTTGFTLERVVSELEPGDVRCLVLGNASLKS